MVEEFSGMSTGSTLRFDADVKVPDAITQAEKIKKFINDHTDFRFVSMQLKNNQKLTIRAVPK